VCTSHTLTLLPPCRAFGFSACVNIAAMIVLQRGDDYGPSVFLFVYVGWMIWLTICTIQDNFFNLDSARYKFLKSPKQEQLLQIRMSMRTEIIIRGLDLMTDAIFFYDGESVACHRFGEDWVPDTHWWPPKTCSCLHRRIGRQHQPHSLDLERAVLHRHLCHVSAWMYSAAPGA
jgi:hypothetical protein